MYPGWRRIQVVWPLPWYSEPVSLACANLSRHDQSFEAMVLLLLARVKVVYFDSIKVDQISLRWSTFLIGSFWKGVILLGSPHAMRNELTRRKLLAEEEKKGL